jgi:hypothetical protein
MSVQQRRFAAATRTAAPKGGLRSRIKLTLTWITVGTALSLFTFTVVGTAATTKPDLAGAMKKLPPSDAMIVINTGNHEVCAVNQTQLTQLQSRYTTAWTTVMLNGTATDLVTVDGASDRDLRNMFQHVQCELVKKKHVFYLPFDAQTS